MPLLHADSGTAGSLRLKIDSRSAELSSVLMDDLRASTVGKSAAVKISAWLLRLGDVDRARDTFLAGRATLVKRRVKQIKFEGDIGAYISELAVVVFTLIKNTCEWYMAAFKDNKLASGESSTSNVELNVETACFSGFVAWATEQLQIFTEMFKRQVYGTDTDRKLVHEALAVTQSHALVVGLSLPAIDLGMQLMLYACNSFETLD